MATIYMCKTILSTMLIGSLLYIFTTPAQAERISDPGELVSFVRPVGWTQVSPGDIRAAINSLNNPELTLIGIDSEKAALLLTRLSDARDIIPHIQVAVHPVAGLGLSEADLEALESTLEEEYSNRMGSRFKLLTMRRVELGGLRAAKITGIYRWRTVNIKILQVLVPGTERLYEITYTAKERDFSRFLEEVEESLGTVQIVDPPLVLDWLWDWAGKLALLFLLALIFLLIINLVFARSGQRRLGAPAERGSAVKPFLKK